MSNHLTVYNNEKNIICGGRIHQLNEVIIPLLVVQYFAKIVWVLCHKCLVQVQTALDNCPITKLKIDVDGKSFKFRKIIDWNTHAVTVNPGWEILVIA